MFFIYLHRCTENKHSAKSFKEKIMIINITYDSDCLVEFYPPKNFLLQLKQIHMKEKGKLRQCGQYSDYIIKDLVISMICFTDEKLSAEVCRNANLHVPLL